jgi:hypothetical protein
MSIEKYIKQVIRIAERWERETRREKALQQKENERILREEEREKTRQKKEKEQRLKVEEKARIQGIKEANKAKKLKLEANLNREKRIFEKRLEKRKKIRLNLINKKT